jgi:hypothetical protein
VVRSLIEVSVGGICFCRVFADIPRLKLTKHKSILEFFALFYVDVLNKEVKHTLMYG